MPLVPAALVTTAEDAVSAADQLAYPVVLQICAAEIAHKSDIGGVKLNLRSQAEVRTAHTAVNATGLKAAPHGIEGVLVSPMRPRSVELFAGVTVDPTFGPMPAVGLGGLWIETLKDVSLAVLPVTPAEIETMLRSLRASALLHGARGGLQAFEVNPFWCLDDRVEFLDVPVVTGENGQPAGD